MRVSVLRLAALTVFALFAGSALADDWNVVRLRGTVLQLVDGDWQPLAKGAVVPDNRVLKTMGNGHATLTRGGETIELASSTQIQIYDQGSKARPFTTVIEHYGTVAVEAEVENVQHFAVKNQYLAAVVKGTRFTVTAKKSGGTVEVERGHVEVDSSTDHSTTLLSAGQTAKVQKSGLKVAGRGKLPTVVKRDASGKALDPVAEAAAAVEIAVADLEQANATGDADAIAAAREALEDAAEDAADVADDAAKSDDKAAAKAAADAAKAAEKAAKDAQKAADKAAKDQAKADADAAKDQAKGDKPGKGPGKSDNPPPPPKDDKPGKGLGKPDSPPPPPKDDKPGKDPGKSDNPPPPPKPDDNSGKGKGDDKPPKPDDHSGKGDDKPPKPDDNSGKGKGDDKPGKTDDDKSGKGKDKPN